MFSQAEFTTWASTRVVLVIADFPRRQPLAAATAKQNQLLQEAYGVKGLPTVVAITADGQEPGRIGYMEGGAGAWLAALCSRVTLLR